VAKNQKVKLEIIDLRNSDTQTAAYVLLLGEADGKRRIPVIIGIFEAQSIAMQLENMKPARPLTHDLFKNFARSFDIILEEVIIDKLEEGVFHSKLVCLKDDERVEVDARTSDAIALAVRFRCPIFTYEHILSSIGFVMDEAAVQQEQEMVEAKGEKKKLSDKDLSSLTVEELNELLKQALDDEAYERASQIRDEIARRKKSS
jgi:bifunctional DNase/RNase